MAKNNIFLGTAAGSVGDVTVYRRSGAQVARVRVRDVANPRTTSQSTQRNFLAPVAKFYAPLAVVLEKSFEGLNKSASYSAFLKKNIEKARENGWYLDKGTPFFPLPYQVSRGTIKPVAYSIDDSLQAVVNVYGTGTTVGAISTAFISAGYQAGDQVTIILINVDDDGNYYPTYARFILEPSSSEPATNILPEIQFNASSGLILGPAEACAVIISRFENNVWRRSTQSVVVRESIVAEVTSESARKAAIASYGDNSYANDGNVYLDGAGTAFNIAAQDGSALLFYGGQYNVEYNSGDAAAPIMLKPANKDSSFYVKIGSASSVWLSGTQNSQPSAWIAGTGTGGSASETIVVESADSDMAKYLMSIGVPVTELS